jgi:hypothetical protein
VPHPPELVIPEAVARAVDPSRAWFVIGGHAVRCFAPYRPSFDVDFGVPLPRDLEALMALLRRKGPVEVLERSADTVHLRYAGVDVSIFVLPKLARFTEQRRLSVTGILASKLHAIVDRGTRRDFFDLYVLLQHERLGLVECMSAVRAVHGPDLNDSLLLRALTFFDDANREASLVGEGPGDWRTVKAFFMSGVGRLLTPPAKKLEIQGREVDVRARGAVGKRATVTKRRTKRGK